MTPYAVFQNNILQNKNLSKHFWGEWEGQGTMVEIRAKKGRKRTGIQTTPMPRGTSAKDGFRGAPADAVQTPLRHEVQGGHLHHHHTKHSEVHALHTLSASKVHRVKSNNKKQLFALSQ